jgi:hypothetical protein
MRRRHRRQKVAGGPAYRFTYVDQPGFEKHPTKTLAALAVGFREYQLR